MQTIAYSLDSAVLITQTPKNALIKTYIPVSPKFNTAIELKIHTKLIGKTTNSNEYLVPPLGVFTITINDHIEELPLNILNQDIIINKRFTALNVFNFVKMSVSFYDSLYLVIYTMEVLVF